MQGPGWRCQTVCVCGVGKGMGIQASCDSEMTSTISLNNCQAVAAEYGSVGSSNAQQTMQRLPCITNSIQPQCSRLWVMLPESWFWSGKQIIIFTLLMGLLNIYGCEILCSRFY